MFSYLDVFCDQTFVQLPREEELTKVQSVCSNEEIETKHDGDNFTETISEETKLKVEKKPFHTAKHFPVTTVAPQNSEATHEWLANSHHDNARSYEDSFHDLPYYQAD